MQKVLRQHAEQNFQHELVKLKEFDKKEIPFGWNLSPNAVVDFIMGTKLKDGTLIEPKYFGKRRLIEIAVGSLATDRGLLLMGIPGTAKTWVSEHLAAAISGDSTLLVQGTAGIVEDSLRYSWNYAQLLTKGPSLDAIVPSPIMTAMQKGKIVRLEELTRIPSDVQDALLSILSEKALPIPELSTEVQALEGFNLIATANEFDKGINEMSSALKRRFNTVVMPLPANIKQEVKIVQNRVDKLGTSKNKLNIPKEEEIFKLVQIFRELRSGLTDDGTMKIRQPSSTLSTAEVISVVNNAMVLATHFGDGTCKVDDFAVGLVGAIVKDSVNDVVIFKEYLETVVKKREEWSSLYASLKSNL